MVLVMFTEGAAQTPGADKLEPDLASLATSDRSAGPVIRGCCAAALILHATPLGDRSIQIDGIGDEPVWNEAAVATDFVQFQPAEGDRSTEGTEARVVYGRDALYVFMRAYDSEPDAVVGQLTRRDQGSHSDQLGVVIDSYFDRRTAFHFAVNPVGVKTDIYRFDDTGEDSGWDAVWDVATGATSDGWAAEFRIPYSQLRFRDADEQTWGINFMREIARRQETAVWAPTARSDGAIVSRFGELRGLRDLSAPNRMEIVPYTLGSLERATGDGQNPYYSPNATFGTAGVDVKYGITSNLTLDVTVNPDFGQVEADPAQVNLSAFETFLPERRPFFVEGSSIFNFGIGIGDGDGSAESLFYSRRVGRAPQGSADPGGGFTEVDDRTTILGAWKLSGKTAGGWSIGALHAVTAEERALVTPAVGDEYQQSVEPFSNYGVLRVQKDFREGRSAVGLIGTGLVRGSDAAGRLELRSSAYTGGVDFRHRFESERWQLSGYVLGSHVRGSAEAIARTQRSPARYFQRPDAERVSYDPDRTSLDGASASVGISKISGGFWRVGSGVNTRTPGFEANDVGFMNSADYLTHWGWLGYHRGAPQGPFRRWALNLNGWHNWNFDGDRTGTGGNVNLNAQLQSYWNVWGGVNRELDASSAGMLRGGPLFRRDGSTNFWGGFGTDSRRAVQVNLGGHGNVRPDSDSWSFGLSPNVRIRPSGRATFNVGAFLNRNLDDRQWVALVETDDPHYVFGRIDQTTVGVTARADYAFTPTLSLQLYAQPFLSAGAYSHFKQVADPMAARYTDRFSPIGVRLEDGRYHADLDGDGSEEAFFDPDFNIRQLRSNVVLRWEYRPGSSLFLVWSQGRDAFSPDGDFDFRSDMRNLFATEGDHVFMVKVSYWMGG
jgi:hypothetical protein